MQRKLVNKKTFPTNSHKTVTMTNKVWERFPHFCCGKLRRYLVALELALDAELSVEEIPCVSLELQVLGAW